MDSYQAIYDAVRSKISGGNVAQAVSEAARQAFDISYVIPLAQQEIAGVGYEMQRPSVLFRPAIYIDGDKWCALYGENLQDGVAGFGDTPAEAMTDFDKNWHQQKVAIPARKCARCGEPNPDNLDMDGCRDPDCPELSH